MKTILFTINDLNRDSIYKDARELAKSNNQYLSLQEAVFLLGKGIIDIEEAWADRWIALFSRHGTCRVPNETKSVWIVSWFRVDDCGSDAYNTFEKAEARAVELESFNMGYKGIRIFHKEIE